jgi:hypothetical protein
MTPEAALLGARGQELLDRLRGQEVTAGRAMKLAETWSRQR